MIEYTKMTLSNKEYNKLFIAFCCDIVLNHLVKTDILDDDIFDHFQLFLEDILFYNPIYNSYKQIEIIDKKSYIRSVINYKKYHNIFIAFCLDMITNYVIKNSILDNDDFCDFKLCIEDILYY